MRYRLDQDVAAGLMFLSFGVAAIYFGQDYEVGTGLRMGPGYLPRILGFLLIGLGLILAFRGLLRAAPPVGRWPLRPILLIPLSLIAFCLLIRPAGLVAAAAAVVAIGAFAGPEFRKGEVAILGIALAALSSIIFVYVLGLPMNVWPD